jgi:hypothetical protein
MSELNAKLEQIGQEVLDFKARYDGRVANMEKQLNAIETHMGRAQFPGGGSSLSGFGGDSEDRRAFSAFLRSGKIMDAMRTDSESRGSAVQRSLCANWQRLQKALVIIGS